MTLRFYNVMMMGLKSFTCATCLCAFGCMTAVHRCPSCKKSFEYSPGDFHRHVSCGSETCASARSPFGFFMFFMSDRAYGDLRAELKQSREARVKTVEAIRRRAAAANRRGGGDGGSDKRAEAAFAAGLSDCCPRCGLSFLGVGRVEEEAQAAHLLACSDGAAIAKHAATKAKAAAKEAIKQAKAAAQDDAEALAAWSFLGAKSEQLWLLSEDQLRKQCADQGVALPPASAASGGGGGDDGGEAKAALVGALAASRALVAHDGRSAATSKGGRLDADTLPDNLEVHLDS